LRDEVHQDRARGRAGFGAYHRRIVYDQEFAHAISVQEGILTALEDGRMDQLRQMRSFLVGTRPLAFTSTKHVVAFVGVMEDLSIDIEGLLPGESAEEA
jgi:hypothetical protein